MPALTFAPTPERFAKTWTQHFAAAVRACAGKDGRLSRSEAKKIAGLNGSLKLWSDNAVNFLEHTDQKTVSVEKLIGSGYNYAYANAAKVAGRGNTVSLTEARRMALDLRDDFAYLRGKLDVDAI